MDNKQIDNFFKEHGTTKFPKPIHINGLCRTGGKKNCPFYSKEGKCMRGWCLAK